MIEFNHRLIRQNSRKQIKGNFLSLFAANLLVELLLGLVVIVKNIPVVVAIIFILTTVLEFGLAMFYLTFADLNNINYKFIFTSYRLRSFRRYLSHLATFLAKYIIILLSATLLLIPGLIKRYSYSQVKYIRVEYPNIGFIRCLRLSKRMMRWHKLELFVLELTLIVWFILIPLTGGLIMVYFQPYYSTLMANYHIYLKSRYDLNKAISKGFVEYSIKYLKELN